MLAGTRISLVCLASVAALAACSDSAQKPVGQKSSSAQSAVVATFEGRYDPATGFSIRTVQGADALGPAGKASAQPLLSFPVVKDNVPNSGPANTLEIRNGTVQGAVINGCGAGIDSFEADIVVTSFYQAQRFSNVYVELTGVAPSTFAACNSIVTAPAGTSNTWGLWSYGPLEAVGAAPANSATAHWAFRYANVGFTFSGRIMADLDFNWTPAAIVTPPHSFVEGPTTTAHVVWNGTASNFVDTRAQFAFTQPLSPPAATPVGLWSPPQTWVGPFPGVGQAYVAVNGGAVNTSGDFSVCVKFKPGSHPGATAARTLLALGNPQGAAAPEGWSLMQTPAASYAFLYRLAGGALLTSATDESFSPAPQGFAFDYACGGRSGTQVLSYAHGRVAGAAQTVAATTLGTALPLAIGASVAAPNFPMTEGGVYEVIFDSRPASALVFEEIVGAAEGRKLSNGATYLAPAAVTGTSVVGADSASYLLPPYATVPLPSDGTGLLAGGSVVEYAAPLTQDTSTTGFCWAAEVVADGVWYDAVNPALGVTGGFLDLVQGAGAYMSINLNPIAWTLGDGINFDVLWEDALVQAGWLAGTAHTIKACIGPGSVMNLYADNVSINAAPVTAVALVPNLSDPATVLSIGQGLDWTPNQFTGGRIRRVFVCAGSNPATCL